MAQDNTKNPVASVRVGGIATVHVLKIEYDTVLRCDRKCRMLTPAEDGTIQCSFKRVNGIADFRTKALLIDYEVILDKSASKNWEVYESYFEVIDADGHIHNGSILCEDFVEPQNSGVKDTSPLLYPGTRATFQIYYPSFPSGSTVASIMITGVDYSKNRISFEEPEQAVSPSSEIQEEQKPVSLSLGELSVRITQLEEEVKKLRNRLYLFSNDILSLKSELSTHVLLEYTPSRNTKLGTVAELLGLEPAAFRDVIIQMLLDQGFKEIKLASYPKHGFEFVIGTRSEKLYAIFIVPVQYNKHSDQKKIYWLRDFRRVNKADKAIYITPGKLSGEVEKEALSNGVEVIDIDKISIMLGLRDGSFGYQPIQQ